MSRRRLPAVLAAIAVPLLLAGCGAAPAPDASAPTPDVASSTASPSASPAPEASEAAKPAIPETPVVLTISGGARHNASGATLTFTLVAHEPQTAGSAGYQQIIDTLSAAGDGSLLLDPAWRASNAPSLMVIDVASTTTGTVAWPGDYLLPVYLGALVGPESHTSLGEPITIREGRFGHGDYLPAGTTAQVIVAQVSGPDGAWWSYPTGFGVPGSTSDLGELRVSDCVYDPTPLADGLESQPGWFVEDCTASFGGE